jgi:hypothetical protein
MAGRHTSVMMRRFARHASGGYAGNKTRTLEDLGTCFLRLAEHGKLINLPEVSIGLPAAFLEHLSYAQRPAVIDSGCNSDRGVPAARTGRSAATSPPAEKPRVECHRLWGWWALNAGHVSTARKHALATLSRAPLSLESWRLAYCAARGH